MDKRTIDNNRRWVEIRGSRMGTVDSGLGNPSEAESEEMTDSLVYARSMDAHDPLRQFRREFIIPSIPDLKRKTLAADEGMCELLAQLVSWDAC